MTPVLAKSAKTEEKEIHEIVECTNMTNGPNNHSSHCHPQVSPQTTKLWKGRVATTGASLTTVFNHITRVRWNLVVPVQVQISH